MAKRFAVRQLLIVMSSAGFLGLSQLAHAAGFQLWEQDAASIGNYHAGVGAIAIDASTGYYNPAGLVMLKNQQIIFGNDIIDTDIRYSGTVNVNTLNGGPQTANVQGGKFNYIPYLNYAAPLSDEVVFGFSIVIPDSLKNNYGTTSVARYATTLSQIQVVDYTPSLGVAFGSKVSVGLGLDIEHLSSQFNQFVTLGSSANDTESNSAGSDNAFGFHAGILYRFNPETRVGLDYHSQVVHHLGGTSKFLGTLANFPAMNSNGAQVSNNFTAKMTLPPITTLSFFHQINAWDLLAGVSYIQWSTLNTLVLQNVAGIQGAGTSVVPSSNLQVTVNQGFQNVWNYSIGANYHPTEKWILRTGLGYDQSPVQNQYRSLQIPDANRVAAAVGAHYQATKTIGFDVGWTHLFIANTRINNLVQTMGSQTVTTNGSVHSASDVLGGQVVWDIL